MESFRLSGSGPKTSGFRLLSSAQQRAAEQFSWNVWRATRRRSSAFGNPGRWRPEIQGRSSVVTHDTTQAGKRFSHDSTKCFCFHRKTDDSSGSSSTHRRRNRSNNLSDVETNFVRTSALDVPTNSLASPCSRLFRGGLYTCRMFKMSCTTSVQYLIEEVPLWSIHVLLPWNGQYNQHSLAAGISVFRPGENEHSEMQYSFGYSSVALNVFSR